MKTTIEQMIPLYEENLMKVLMRFYTEDGECHRKADVTVFVAFDGSSTINEITTLAISKARAMCEVVCTVQPPE